METLKEGDTAMRLAMVLALVLLSGTPGVSQSGVVNAASRQKSATSGKQLYETHCGVCHGADAKGGGPYAPQLKTWPPDLTTLAKRNGGTFPAMRINETIDGEFDKSPHGSREMPIWGPVFRNDAHGHEDNAQLRIKNLVKYIESLQEK